MPMSSTSIKPDRIKASDNRFQITMASLALQIERVARSWQGNMRLIDRLMKQVERVLVANQLTVVAKEVAETACKDLIIGFE